MLRRVNKAQQCGAERGRASERAREREQENAELQQQYKDSHIEGPKTNCPSFLHLEHRDP